MRITEYVNFNWDDSFPGDNVKKALSVLDEMNLNQEEISILASMCYKSLSEFQGDLLDKNIETNIGIKLFLNYENTNEKENLLKQVKKI